MKNRTPCLVIKVNLNLMCIFRTHLCQETALSGHVKDIRIFIWITKAGITLHIVFLILLLKRHSCLPIVVPSPFISQPTFLEQS